jgi:hypothetical protein
MKNTISNQQIIDNIKLAKARVEKEIFCNQSALVTHLIATDENCKFETEGCEVTTEDAQNYESEVLEHLNEGNDGKKFTKLTPQLIAKFEEEICAFLCHYTDARDSKLEWYEAWVCSDWFLYKIREQNGLVGNFDGLESWWLRQTTGQSFWLDGIIENIVLDLAAAFSQMTREELEKEIRSRKLNNGSKYLCGLVCNIEYIKAE